MADQESSLPDQPAIEDAPPEQPKQAKAKKKKKKKKQQQDSEGEKATDGPSDKSDKHKKKADSGSEAEPKPPKKKRKSGSEVEEPAKRKKKTGKKGKQPPASDKEIAIEDPPPEAVEEHAKSVSIKSHQSGKSQKKEKRKGKKKSKKELPGSTDPTDREKNKEPVEATAVQHTDSFQQKQRKTGDDQTPKRKESSVSKEETIYNEKDGDRRNDDYDPSETVKRGGSSGKSDKDKPVARIPDPPSDKKSSERKKKEEKEKEKEKEQPRGTPTPLTDVTQDHKPIDPDNLTERLKADIAKREKELRKKIQKTPADTTNSPSSEPPTPRRKAAREAQKKKGSQEAVKPTPSAERRRKAETAATCTEHSKEKRGGKTEASDKSINVVKVMRRLGRPRAVCCRGPKRGNWDYWRAWPRCRRFSVALYWVVGCAATAALLVWIFYTELLP